MLDKIERLIAHDPVAAAAEVESWLADPDIAPTEQIEILVALARAQRDAGDLHHATATLASTVARAEMLGAAGRAPALGSLIRATAETFANYGRAHAGIALCRQLSPHVRDADQIDLLLVLGALHRDAGALQQARRYADDALRRIDDLDDAERRCRLLNNRGVLNLDLGDYDEAEADFARAEQIARQLSLDLAAASCAHNRGVALARLGHLHRALQLLDLSASFFERHGHTFALLEALLDRVAVLVDSGLTDEARTAARLSAEAHLQLDARAGLETTRHLQARIESVDGNWAAAVDYARQEVELAESTDSDGERASRARDRLRLLTFVADGNADHLDAGRLAPDALDDSTTAEVALHLIASGRTEAARPYLAVLSRSRSKSADAELHRCLAHAQLASLDGDDPGVERWVNAGLDAAESNTVCLAATDLRALALRRISQLGDIGVRLAVARGAASAAAELVDRVRSVSLLPEPPLSDDEAALVARLRELRHDEWRHGTGTDGWAHLVKQRLQVETSLRSSRRRHARPGAPRSIGGTRAVDATAATFVYLKELDGDVLALVVGPDDRSILTLGKLTSLYRPISALSLLLDTIATGTADRSDVAPLVRAVGTLLRPVLDRAGAGTLVVVSDAKLPLVPWSLLTDRPVTIAASVGLGATPAPIEPTSTVRWIAGPGIAHAESELAAIEAAWPAIERVGAGRATVTEAIDALGRPGIAHVSAHGRFRRDNPLFSEVQLIDGPLTFYDLLRRSECPHHIVFASCELGRDAIRSPLGAFSVLQSRGCDSMLASAGLIGDASVARLMGAYYTALATATSPAVALARSLRGLVDDDPSLSLMMCFGAG